MAEEKQNKSNLASNAASAAAGAAAKKVAGAAGKAATKAAGKAGGAALKFLVANPVSLIIIGVMIVIFAFGFIITNWNQVYFQGYVGFEDAPEYADVAASQQDIRASEEVQNYYTEDETRYEGALAMIQPMIDLYLSEIEEDDDERWEASTYSSLDDYEHVSYTVNGTGDFTAENLFSRDELAEYLTSYILDKGTAEQLQRIENGGEDAVSAISELETRLFANELTMHSTWYCTSEEDMVVEESIDVLEDGSEYLHYHCYNTYSIAAYEGTGIAYQSDGVEWDTVKNDDDLDRVIDLYTSEEEGNTENVRTGLELYHNSGTEVSSGDGTVSPSIGSFFESIGNFLSNILQSLWEAFQRELSELKIVGPVDKVTTLRYGSSAYATSSYAGRSAALAAIELCRNSQYVLGGRNPNTGVDCSGLVYVAYMSIGYTDIAGNSAAQRQQCNMLNQLWDYSEWYDNRLPGDLVLMRGHVVMYVGTTDDMRSYGVSNEIIEEEGLSSGVEYCISASTYNADKPGDGVIFRTLESSISDSRYIGIGRPYESIDLEINADEQSLYTYFTTAGMTPEGAAGLIGNLVAESHLNPMATNSSGYFGLAQWGPGRKQNLIAFCEQRGYAYTSITGQVEFIIYEMQTSYSGVWNHLQSCPSATFAAQDIALKYEICIGGDYTYTAPCYSTSEKLQGLPSRITNAERIYNTYAHAVTWE